MKVKQAFDHFRHALECDRLAQAYLIEAPPRGEGQELVDRLVQLLFCTAKGKPCGECSGCRTGREHTHPDLAWIEPQKKSRTISVEQIREAQKQIFQTSFLGGWKVCVIFSADRLGSEAANAFLKVLEEPPGRSAFFLLTDSPQFLLPTVISRCQHVRVAGEDTMIRGEWANRVCEILRETEGGAGTVNVLACADRFVRLFGEIKQEAADAVAGETEGDSAEEDEETTGARISARYREIRAGLMKAMLLWHRDVLLLSCGADEGAIHFLDQREALKKKAGKLSPQRAQKNVETVEAMNRRLERNLSERAVLTQGFIEIR